jgi:Uncharacterized protein conserved in bacteria (DUF2066)
LQDAGHTPEKLTLPDHLGPARGLEIMVGRLSSVFSGGLIAALALSIASATAAQPGDKVFTVANYPVEAEAANAVAAKDKALADGQDAAFRSLLKRLVPVTAYAQLSRLKDVKTADLIDGVRSRSEQNSPTRYIAAFDFAFQPDAVRDVLAREGLPFVAEPAPETLIIPLMRQANAAQPYAPASTAWTQAWRGLDLENSLSPLKLSALNAQVHSDTVTMMQAGDGSADRIINGEYNTDRVIVAIAEIDTAAKQVHVTLAGRDAVGPFSWKRSYRASDGDTGYAMELAAVIGLGVLEGRWKVAKTGGAGAAIAAGGLGEDVELEVVFANQSEWNDIRGRLLDLQGVDDVRVVSITARNAQMGLKYPGGGNALASSLAQHGLNLSRVGSQWQLRSAFQ